MPLVVSSWSYLTNLTRLVLLSSKLDEDSFSNLLVLQGLSYLELFNAYDGKRLQFPAGSFPKLRVLVILGAPQLNKVEVAEGAMECLVELVLSRCPELKFYPHGIEYLTSLERLDIPESLMR
uniref:NB-ARC domain-containing protein n=1 Tax=Arundo donax TaxID=35708 RepID=A0A0A9BEU8_ARUDO